MSDGRSSCTVEDQRPCGSPSSAVHDRRMTTDMHEPPALPIEPRSSRPWLPWLIGAILVVVAAAVAGVIATSADDSGGRDTAGTRELAAIQQACAQWRDGYRGSSVPSSAWCGDMVGWMSNRMNGGQMMGSMMWRTPQQMRETCQQWMSGHGKAGDNASTWCDDMVDWMERNVGDWGRGSMMPGGAMMDR